MKRFAAVLLLAVSAATVAFCSQPKVSMDELISILGIRVWRVRVPTDTAYVWDIHILTRNEQKTSGPNPTGLSKATKLLAFRDVDSEQCIVVEITNEGDSRPSRFIALVRVRSRP